MLRRPSLRVLLSLSLLTVATVVPLSAAAEPVETPLLSWGPCPEGSNTDTLAECAELSVPRDYSDPSGPQISLTMSRIPATGERHGVIAGNPGGPGGDALGMFTRSSTGSPGTTEHIVLPTSVREHFDLVAVEPRGLTWATPLDCPVAPSPNPTAAQVFIGCESTNPGYTRTITTDNTARDLNEARKALGEDRLNLYGLSYGGILMSTYATLFPSHTDRLLLDSSASPDQRWFGLGTVRKQARIDGLNAMFSWLADRDGTYHLGTTPLQVYQRWAEVVATPYGVQLPTTPPAAQAADLPPGSAALPGELALTVTNAVTQAQWRLGTLADNTLFLLGDPITTNGIAYGQLSLMQGLYNQNLWPLIGEQLRDPEAAIAAAEAYMAELPTPTDKEIAAQLQMALQLKYVEQAIICNENAVAPDPSRILPTLETQLTGGDRIRANEDLLASGQICLGWPTPIAPTTLSGVNLGHAPLSIGYTNDTATTASGARDMHRTMGGELILLEGYSHGVLVNNPDRLAAKVSAYFS